jgi:hypothetical protein
MIMAPIDDDHDDAPLASIVNPGLRQHTRNLDPTSSSYPEAFHCGSQFEWYWHIPLRFLACTRQPSSRVGEARGPSSIWDLMIQYSM